ncbi:MAG: LruC domain-containing protein [Pseudomonadota bacterium]
MYDVNLVTGDYGLLEDDMGTRRAVNAIGFSVHDRYIYVWNYATGGPARVGDDYQVEPLEQAVVTTDRTFFIGDVSVLENRYYVYRRGSNYGLYYFNLDETADDYLQQTQVVDGGTLSMRIFDMAFHPTDGFAYAVDKTGILYQIDVTSGSAIELGNVGVSGTFGAAYFDVEGRLYFSRNNDGNLYSVDIDGQDFNATLFAVGPSSGNNDGARCALAPLQDNSDTDVDFGDAPLSYGTSLAANGARHGIPENATLFLGSELDGESDAAPFPLSDDEIDSNDDDDGLQLATGIEAGLKAVMIVTASESGILNGWVDFDQDGTFDPEDQVVTDLSVNAGPNVVAFDTPPTAVAGDTWARFRIASTGGLLPTGGVSDGEVEDYQVEISSASTSVSWYPGSNSFTTIGFEDNWPFEGDYDMNDLVARMRTGVFRSNGEVTAIRVFGEIAAVGAAYENGFGIRLPGILASQVDASNVVFKINDLPEDSPLEGGRVDAIFMISYNVWNTVEAGEDCTFHRTEPGCGGAVQFTFDLTIPLTAPIVSNIMGAFDPFLFATPGAFHGDFFTDPPGRAYEIHLKNQAPTEAADLSIFGLEDDASIPGAALYYQTSQGLPWALEVARRWDYPREFMDLLWAYPQFDEFVESDGAESPDWFSAENYDEFFIFFN